MAYLTVDAHRPLIVARRAGAADAASITTMLAWVRGQLLASDRKVVYLYDAGEAPGGLPDAAARRAAGEWLRRHGALLREKCAGMDFALAAPVSRGALTAVLWIAPPTIPWAVHATLTDAVKSAVSRTGAKLDADAIVRDLAARPSV